MKPPLNELISICEKQSDLHRSLVTALKREKTAIIEAKLLKLNKANSEKEALVREIKKLENKRLSTIAKLAEDTGVKEKELTLEKLCQSTKEPYSSKMNTCRKNLISLTKKVRELNEGNKLLLFHSVELIKSSLTFLNNLMDSNAVYFKTGKIQNRNQTGRVFSGEI